MRTAQATSSVLMMAVGVALTSVAVIAVHAALRAEVRWNVAALVERPALWWGIALACAVTAALLFVALWRINRGYFFQVSNAVVHPHLLLRELTRLWAVQFPQLRPPSDVWLVRGRNWTIQMELPRMQPVEEERLLAEASRHVGVLLKERFGFTGPYTLDVRSVAAPRS